MLVIKDQIRSEMFKLLNLVNLFEIILIGTCYSTKKKKKIEIFGKEKESFELFLGTTITKTVILDKILGIGGEGLVMEKEMKILLFRGTTKSKYSPMAENIVLRMKKKMVAAVKFVKFDKYDGEDFTGLG